MKTCVGCLIGLGCQYQLGAEMSSEQIMSTAQEHSREPLATKIC